MDLVADSNVDFFKTHVPKMILAELTKPEGLVKLARDLLDLKREDHRTC